MSYSAIVRAIYGSVWAILPEKLEAIAAFVKLKASGGNADPEIIAAIHAENKAAAARASSLSAGRPGTVAVLPLYGIINQRYSGDISGPSGTSVQGFTQQFRQVMADPNISAVVIDVDSPGGTVSGVDELATEIYNARKQGTKKIIAVSNCLCASAAYYIAAQANEVCVSPSSLTGSIGVYSLHEDDSELLAAAGIKVTLISAGKYKTEGNNFGPLEEEARAAFQTIVDDAYGMFTKAVARGRGVTPSAVVNGFGQGRVLTAKEAVKAGLADRVATLDEVLAKYTAKQPAALGAAASAPESRIEKLHERRGEDADGKPNQPPFAAGAAGSDCSCQCDSCMGGDCSNCTHEGCDAQEENCVDCPMAESAADPDAAQVGQLPAAAQCAALARAEAAARNRRLRLARV